MNNPMLIQVIHQKALAHLRELEELHLIKVLGEGLPPVEKRLSDKYRGVFSREDAKSFDEHTQKLRGEWDNI
jgi:hypothetical protein